MGCKCGGRGLESPELQITPTGEVKNEGEETNVKDEKEEMKVEVEEEEENNNQDTAAKVLRAGNKRKNKVEEEEKKEEEKEKEINPLDKLKSKNPKLICSEVSSSTFDSYTNKIPNFETITKEKGDNLKEVKENIKDLSELKEIPLTEFSNDGEKYIYQGTVDPNGNLMGYGKLLIPSNNTFYEGEFLSNLFNGKGLLISGQGDSFFGNFKNGEAYGDGELKMNNGGKYTGQFLNSVKEGNGKEEYPNGNMYSGNFYQNQRSGNGKYIFKKGDQKEMLYTGNFEKGEMNDDNALIQWFNGKTYRGGLKQGQFNGQGALTFVNGDQCTGIYRGNFKDGKKEGKGAYEWSNGDKLYGTWMDDKLEGKASVTLKEGNYMLNYIHNEPNQLQPL